MPTACMIAKPHPATCPAELFPCVSSSIVYVHSQCLGLWWCSWEEDEDEGSFVAHFC